MATYEKDIYDLIERIKNQLRASPLVLGGISSPNGGAGGPPGGFIGYLPQTRVSYDQSELASATTSGLPSLLDNLNHIRGRIFSLEGTVSGLGSGWHVIQDEGTSFPQRTNLNFTGSGVNVVDDEANDRTIVIFPDNYVDITGDTMTGNLGVPGIQFDLTYSGIHQEGLLHWNEDDGTLEIGMSGGDINLQIGQEQLIKVTNGSGGTILNGKVVRITGAQGQRPVVAYGIANDVEYARRTLGVLTEDILNNQQGYVTTFGYVRGINTSGLTEGATVYLSPTVSGGLTSTKPDAPYSTVRIGLCVYTHATEGIIYVNVTPRQVLNTLSDVLTASPQIGEVLSYDGEKWINATVSGVSGGAGSQDYRWFIDGALAVVSGVGQTFIAPRDATIEAVYIHCKDTGTSGNTLIDVNKNGTSIFTTQTNRPTLAYNDANKIAKSGTPEIVSLAENDLISIDIDSVAPGADGLSVVIAMNTSIASNRHVIYDEGSAVTERPGIDFVGFTFEDINDTIRITAPSGIGAVDLDDLDDVTIISPAEGNLMVYTVASGWINKSPVNIIKDAYGDGWIPFNDPSIAGGAIMSISFTGDIRNLISIGTKIKLIQGTQQYFYVQHISYSAPYTYLNLNGGSDYFFNWNLGFSDVYFSNAESPDSFPQWFNWDATPSQFSANPANAVYKFCISHGTVYFHMYMPSDGTSSGTTFTVDLPMQAHYLYDFNGTLGLYVNNGALATVAGRWFIDHNNPTYINFYTNMGTGAWTATGGKRACVQGFYEIELY